MDTAARKILKDAIGLAGLDERRAYLMLLINTAALIARELPEGPNIAAFEEDLQDYAFLATDSKAFEKVEAAVNATPPAVTLSQFSSPAEPSVLERIKQMVVGKP